MVIQILATAIIGLSFTQLILIFGSINLTAFGPNSEAVFDLFKKRLISEDNALGLLAIPNNF
ncbi:hypothetical protein D1BOALGB6SA_153 [Olavius sp. associated proteobacterium Delta 1]|nr:hypothetical protein D1BOALGB6SA_153 [Olavius sp. associated proteobacterium Delta 1]